MLGNFAFLTNHRTPYTAFIPIKEILGFLQEQDASLRDTADSLFWISNGLKSARYVTTWFDQILWRRIWNRTPNYDVPTAIDVLTTGSYQRLPAAIIVSLPLSFSLCFPPMHCHDN